MRQKNFILFLLASGLIGVTQSVDTAVVNNFLNDVFHITVYQRTLLEIPREFPGFAVVFVSGILFYLGDIRTAAVANLLGALGMFGMAYFSPSYTAMVGWLAVYSMGQHLFMPMSSSIAMSLSDTTNMGKKMGQINAANTAVFLATSLAIAYLFRFIRVDYRLAFGLGVAAFLGGALLIIFMSETPGKRVGKRFVLRKHYSVFYWLSVLNGARKQIFLTFGPWVLIKIFDQGVSTFAILGFIVAALGILFKPMVGYFIDRLGERFVLAGEAIGLVLVCLGYAYAKHFFVGLGRGDLAFYTVAACFVIDQLLTAAGMARATYLNKIAVKPEEVSPTLSMGISMDHVVSMFIPWLGGFIWTRFGYEYVFLGGAGIAVLYLFLTSLVRLPSTAAEQ